MNIKPLLEKTTKNWPQKAICFALAVLIYFFHQLSLLETKSFAVPLEIKAEGSMLPVSGHEKNKIIKVKVRTKKEYVSSLTEKDFMSYVDITQKDEEGTFDFPVCIQPSERVILMEPLEIYVKPDNMKLEIQKKRIKAVPVRATIAGEPAYGYKFASVNVEPSYMTICGPRKIIDATETLQTELININTADRAITKEVKAVNLNSYISILDDQNIKASVSIVPAGMIKNLENVLISYANLQDNLEVSSADVFISVTIEGNLLDIEKFNEKNFSAYVDCSSISESGSYDLDIRYNISGSLKITDSSISTIQITVANKEDEEKDDNIESTADIQEKKSSSTMESDGEKK